MQLCHKGPNPGKASTIFLPMIDLKSTDPQCVYSTLHFVASQSIKYRSSPIITFDQPLAWLAWLIIANEGPSSPIKDIVVRLGSFHAEMSFLGAIGHNMGGSGLEDLLELIYASVHHIMAGHAVSRANRAHILMDAVLSAMLISSCLGIHVNSFESDSIDTQDTEEYERETAGQTLNQEEQLDIHSWNIIRSIEQLYENIKEDGVHKHSLEDNENLQKLDMHLKAYKESIKDSRTAQLWLQYMDSTEKVRNFKICERTGDFLGHLYYMEQMMPILAAAGHNLYVKSISIYLKQMKNLPDTHPQVYNHFLRGYHVVRSSKREFSGRPMDLYIEQELNRNLKTSGGLTHGSGFDELQRTTWLLSRSTTAYCNKKIQEFANVFQKTVEQNKDLSVARMERDMKDMKVLWDALFERNPFTMGKDLINIWNGQHAHENVNVDKALDIGRKTLEDMNGKTPEDYTFRRCNQAITMASKQGVKVGKDKLQISYRAMFQRLSVVAAKSNQPDMLENVLRTELCTYAPSLFESPLVMKEAKKSDLANALWTLVNLETISIPANVQWVIDGGMLIHLIPWKRGSTYQEIFDSYIKFISVRFPQGKIVFDGYLNSSIKDGTHTRRTKGQTSAKISFTKEMTLVVNKDIFLLNVENKQRFVNLLGQELRDAGYEVHHAEGDADRLIIEVALLCNELGPTAIAADDTDILCMALDASINPFHDLFIAAQRKQKKGTRKVWDVKQVQEKLPLISKHILFLHTFLGCDTTSRVHGIGKAAPLSTYSTNIKLQECANIFLQPNAQKEDIIQAGEKAFLLLYKSKKAKTLNTLRHHMFAQRVSTKMAQVDPAKLPPTSSAAKFHSLRVYLQICMMKSSACSLNPEDWGWLQENNVFYPIVTDQSPAPDSLLQLIKCGCKGNCATRACTCVSNGMKCAIACENCKGSACTNATIIDVDPIEADEDLDE